MWFFFPLLLVGDTANNLPLLFISPAICFYLSLTFFGGGTREWRSEAFALGLWQWQWRWRQWENRKKITVKKWHFYFSDGIYKCCCCCCWQRSSLFCLSLRRNKNTNRLEAWHRVNETHFDTHNFHFTLSLSRSIFAAVVGVFVDFFVGIFRFSFPASVLENCCTVLCFDDVLMFDHLEVCVLASAICKQVYIEWICLACLTEVVLCVCALRK